MNFESGPLRHRLTIQVRADPQAQDAQGEVTTQWTTFATVWAAVNPVTGQEVVNRESWNATVTHKITIRRRRGVKPDMRMMWGDRNFNIKAVLESNVPVQMDCMCEEVIR